MDVALSTGRLIPWQRRATQLDQQAWPWGKEVVSMKRVLVLATVVLVVAAMMVAMAMPALAARSAPTK